MKRLLLPILLILIVTVIGAACSGSAPAPTVPAPPAQPTTAPAQTLDGKALMNERCTVCHSTERIQAAKKTRADWEATVSRMKGKGAKLNDAETTALVDFLAATYK